ncbi:SDR family oxidoreductase [Dyella halodurans]|uniref:SDR family NAD(P)-dependent oxidoreductase n=1 Tax=Dyella halodurans TaxID=1920171 RepID=A0ABV9BZ55_9GAMM|nr:SDR family oxidoreductase [Dyella halodurans]
MSPFATYPSLVDRHVFISGGASGIGAALVEHFADQGSRVSFVDIDEANGKLLVDALGHARHRPRFLSCDVTDLDALKAAIDAARAAHGPIGVLINNAANDVRHAFDATTPQDFDRNIAVNLRHHYFATQAVRDDMRELGAGSVICLGSTGWMKKNAGYPVYAAAKAAILGLVNGLARELGKERIRINALVPGWVITPKQRELWLDAAGEADIARLQCLPGYLLADDIARAALFLAADDSRMCTGQQFIVDGGWA